MSGCLGVTLKWKGEIRVSRANVKVVALCHVNVGLDTSNARIARGSMALVHVNALNRGELALASHAHIIRACIAIVAHNRTELAHAVVANIFGAGIIIAANRNLLTAIDQVAVTSIVEARVRRNQTLARGNA